MKKLFILFIICFSFIACATSQKQEEPTKETGFVMSQEELEEFFPIVDPAETGHCTRCGIVTNQYKK